MNNPEDILIPDPVQKVSLSCSNLKKSVEFWKNTCGMTLFSESAQTATLGYSQNQVCGTRL